MRLCVIMFFLSLVHSACLGQQDLPDAVQQKSRFMRGDFAQVIYQKNYRGRSEIVEPKGEFAEIDVAETNELLMGLVSSDLDRRKKAIDRFKAESDRFAPPAFFVAASQMFDLGEKDEAAFWLMVGRLRAISDAMKCGDPSAHQAILVLNHQFGMRIEEEFANWRKLKEVMRKVITWDQNHDREYDPRWIALHGMEAFEKTKVSFEPRERWNQIDRQTRSELRGAFDSIISAAQEADKDGDGILSEEEKLALAGTPLEVAPKVRAKSMCGDVLFNDVLNMPGGIRTWDEINFPNAKQRRVVDIEVVVPLSSARSRTGVERWTVERDGKGACYYTVELIPDGSGGTYIVTADKCEPVKKK
jgi:hypothetical protein